jgi:hypothetical protein
VYLLPIPVNLDPPLKETSKVPQDLVVHQQSVTTDPLVCLNPTNPVSQSSNNRKAGDKQVIHIMIIEHLITRIGNRRPTIYVGRVRIRSNGGPPLKMLETLVIALSGSEDRSQGIPKRIEGDDV